MKMCKEMIKLRKGLDERGIVWIDASETYGDDKIKDLGIDITIYRTHFTAYGVWFSVVYGYSTYGNERGLLECMSKAVDESGEPKGSMTADEILEIIDELKNDVEDALKSIIDAPITKAEPIKHGRWIAIRNGKMKHWKEQCSVCGRMTRGRYPYCRSCGARMDGDVNE